MERFNLKKLNGVKLKEEFQVKISNRFLALKNLENDANVYNIWCSIRESMKASAAESLGYYQFKQYKPRFDEMCSK
jgi:hypothetical protein